MKRALFLGSLGILTLGLISCNSTKAPVGDITGQSSSASEMALPDVSYEGIVEEMGMTIYQQGSHKLILSDGNFLLLESSLFDLSTLVGKRVVATGTVNDTVEAGGKIMTVSSIALTDVAESSEASSESMTESSSSESSAASEVSSSSSSAQAVSSSSKAAPPPPPASSSVASSVAPLPVSSSSEAGQAYSPEMTERIEKMSKDKGEGSWTQQYCSAHIGLRFPVRSDWWYHSFGATTSHLWHVELNTEEVKNIGDGPISVNLVSGRVAEGQQDGTVTQSAGIATGTKSWSDNRHIEVTGPAALKSAIEYITKNISTCDSAAGNS